LSKKALFGKMIKIQYFLIEFEEEFYNMTFRNKNIDEN
jgi:hypothetical protein